LRKLVKRYLSVAALSLLLVAVVWFYLLSPASVLENSEISRIVVASQNPHQSLWDLGFNKADLEVVTIESANLQPDPDLTRTLDVETTRKVSEALKQPSRSCYATTYPDSRESSYLLVIRFNQGEEAKEGVTLYTANRATESQGKFYGWTFDEEGSSRRFVYINPELGKVLNELRQTHAFSPEVALVERTYKVDVYDVVYPALAGMADESVQDDLNQKILETALGLEEDFPTHPDDRQYMTYQADYEVHFKRDRC